MHFLFFVSFSSIDFALGSSRNDDREPDRPLARGGYRGFVDHPSSLLVLEPVTLAFNVDGGRVMQQPVQDGAGDDVVREDRAPIAIAFIAGQDHRSMLVTLTD